MTICSEIQSQLGAYLARNITPAERKEIQAHLASCTDCRGELESLAALHGTLRHSLHKRAAMSEPDPRLRERVRFKVSQSWRGGTTDKTYRRVLATGHAGERAGSLAWIKARFSAGLSFIGRIFTGSHWTRMRNAARSAAAKIHARIKK